ncbi:hypothetical protein MPTK2_1g01180 [Marchantia polymorpha subsp. ruderalis]
MESCTSSAFDLPPARATDSDRPRNNRVEVLASERDELQRIVQIFIRLRSRRLEQEGVHMPLLVVVTDASGRETCPVELLELLGGSRLAPGSCGTRGSATPQFAIALHVRGCRRADEPSSYEIEYSDVKKELSDLFKFPAEIQSAIEHLHHKIETDLHEDPIFLRLCSDRHAELAGVFFRWEKCSDDVETFQIEYQLPDQPIVKQVSWDALEHEIPAARTSMRNSNVVSDILIRARSPNVHPIPTVFKLDGCPTAAVELIAHNGRTRRIRSRENVSSEIESARDELMALRRKRADRSPIVLHVRRPDAIDFIRVDLPTDMADDSAGTFVRSVAALIARLLKPERESLVLTVLSADEEHSTAFDSGLSHVLDKIAILQTIDDMRWSLVRQMQQRQLARRLQLRDFPARRGTNLRSGLELLKIRNNVFRDLEQFMMSGGIGMISDNEVLHFATRVSSIFRKYTKQLLPEEDVFPPTDDFPDANAVEMKENRVDPMILLKLYKELDKVQDWVITLVNELHDYTKLFVFYVLEKYISTVPHLLKKYRKAAVEALREACAVSRDFISCTVGDEKAFVVGLDVGGLPVLSTIYLRRRYKLVQNKITLKLTTLFSEAVDTHMKTKIIDKTRLVNKSILRELTISYNRKREDLKARILMLKDSIGDLSY